MTSKICPKTGREVFCANNAKMPMSSFESHCSHVSPFEAELNPGSFLILGVPGGVAPVWSWADKSPCLANSASMTTSGWKHWRKSEHISGKSKLGEVTWIGLLFEFHLSSTSSMSQVVCRYGAYPEKKVKTPLLATRNEWLLLFTCRVFWDLPTVKGPTATPPWLARLTTRCSGVSWGEQHRTHKLPMLQGSKLQLQKKEMSSFLPVKAY